METYTEDAPTAAGALDEDAFEDAERFYEEELCDLVTGQQADFRVETEAEADWVMNKITGWEREIEARKTAFIAEERKLKRKVEWFKKRFSLELEDFAIQRLMAQTGKKTKSLRLPCGAKLGYRQVPRALAVVNDEAFEAFVLNNLTQFVDFRPHIDKKAVKEHAFDTGEIPDGTKLEEAYDKFYLQV
jgi:hypothetical protein